MKESSKARKIKAGLLLTTLAAAVGAVTAAVLLQRKREEEVYHEAELKAMDELEAFMRDEDADDCAEECASVDLMQEEDESAADEADTEETEPDEEAPQDAEEASEEE